MGNFPMAGAVLRLPTCHRKGPCKEGHAVSTCRRSIYMCVFLPGNNPLNDFT